MNKKLQKVLRVYPPGWSGDSVGLLNKMLEDGWIVVLANPITYDGKSTFNDYLLEKQNE